MSVRDDVAAAIDAWLAPYEGAVPGASLLVRQGGEDVLRSAGRADLESGAAATAHTNYRLASISKQFTAAAVLLLVEASR